MDRSTVHNTHMAINMAHRSVYFVPEAAEEYAALGVTGRAGYFASRSAPLGRASDQLIIATFYNFAPRAVTNSMPGVWDTASPEAFQAARFRVAQRSHQRVGAIPSEATIAEALAILNPVVASLDFAGKPLAAANAAVAFPADPFLALWQQLTIIREWRGDAHIALLLANSVSPCECMVLQAETGRFPLAMAMASRQWNEQEWAAATASLAKRGWVDSSGAITPAGTAAREAIEDDTDRLCEPIWESVVEAGAVRIAEIGSAMNDAFVAAGTYGPPK